LAYPTEKRELFHEPSHRLGRHSGHGLRAIVVDSEGNRTTLHALPA